MGNYGKDVLQMWWESSSISLFFLPLVLTCSGLIKSLVLTMLNSTSDRWIWEKDINGKFNFSCTITKSENLIWLFFYILLLVLNPRSSARRQRFVMRVKTWTICQITFKRTNQKAWTTAPLLATFIELLPKPVVKKRTQETTAEKNPQCCFYDWLLDIASTSLMA